MEWLKWISGLTYALFGMASGNSVSAVELADPDSVNASITDSELKTTFVDLINTS